MVLYSGAAFTSREAMIILGKCCITRVGGLCCWWEGCINHRKPLNPRGRDAEDIVSGFRMEMTNVSTGHRYGF